jgi:hypothetical protein
LHSEKHDMSNVFIVQHENDQESVFLIGVYATEADAQAAVERAKKLPGFKDYPGEFFVDFCTINKDHWTEGYFRSYRDDDDA